MSAARPSSGWFESLSVRSKLTLALSVQLLVLTVGCLCFLVALRELSAARNWTTHTYEVIRQIESLRAEALEQQTGLRGYIITADRRFLGPYYSGLSRFDATAAGLAELIQDNPAQLERLAGIEQLMGQWRTDVAAHDIAAMADAGTRHLAFESVARAQGARLINAIKLACLDMSRVEAELLALRSAELNRQAQILTGLILLLLVVGGFTGLRTVLTLDRMLGEPLSQLAQLLPRLGEGERVEIPYRERRDEVGALSAAFERLRDASIEQRQREWMNDRTTQLIGALQGTHTEKEFSEVLLRHLCQALDAGYALAYRWNDETAQLEWCAAYGLPDESATRHRFQPGEGLVGQAMVDGRRIELSPVPEGYLQVVSGLGAALLRALLFVPLSARGQGIAVLELGLLRDIEPRHRALLDQVNVTASLAWDALARSIRTRTLLEQSQAQGEELKSQQEALNAQQEQLRAANDSLRARGELLEEQGRQLQASEEELRAQTEELTVTNTMLEENTAALHLRQSQLQTARDALERKAGDLEQASRYKSEFLANMSHELRTPLNSMLILSKLLADNAEGTLDADQMESARIVHDSGKSLLNLINDILDLSKVEAGKMALVLEDVYVAELLNGLVERFQPLARERGLQFELGLGAGVPLLIHTDGARLMQMLSNLLSNAFKFTHEGKVELSAERDPLGVIFSVRDSGIGIPADRLARVFQAFEQAESSTSRRYGGTGLGLSIVSGMAALLGGQVRVQSQQGRGSVFSIVLPERITGTAPAAAPVGVAQAVSISMDDDEDGASATVVLRPAPALDAPEGPPALLVVEDDPAFAQVLADIATRRGLEVLVAHSGEQALEIARRRRLSGVLLDIGLPDISGWKVLEKLKAGAHTARVPVHVISGNEDAQRSLERGAVSFTRKPVTRESVLQVLESVGVDAPARRRLLLVDDDSATRAAVCKLLRQEEADIEQCATGDAGLRALERQTFDGLILDLALPDISGFEFLERASRKHPLPPVVIYSARELNPEETLRLRAYTQTIVIKGARAPERLLDEVSLFLHSLDRPGTPAHVTPAQHAPIADLAGKTVLVVDDDMRNVFALSKVLRSRGLEVLMAQDGHKALAQLEARNGADNNSAAPIALVLMDIMMPGMDGYETIRRIRARAQWQQLPIIAVTAKAMQGDREKCIEAGANDYCPKPIDIDQLMSQLQVWI